LRRNLAIAFIGTILASPIGAGAGTIAGIVTNTSGSPIPMVWVDAYDVNTNWIDSSFTDIDGTYAVTNLPPELYYVRTFVLFGWYIDEWYDDVPVNGYEIPAAAQPVAVTTGITAGVNFGLTEGGAIRGVVTDSGGLPLADIWLDAYDVGGTRRQSGLSTTNGLYEIGGLPEGVYFVRTDSGEANYVDEWFRGIPVEGGSVPGSAEPVIVVSGGATSNINFSLAPGSRVTGTITKQDNGPLQDIWVDVYTTRGEWVKTGRSGFNGNYLIQSLRSGSYFLRTFAEPADYADEWFDDIPAIGTGIPTNAAVLHVPAGATLSNINFALSPGGWISGIVTNTAGLPVTAAGINVYSPGGTWVKGATTTVTGTYTITGLPAGTFYVRTTAAELNYVDEWFDNVPALGYQIPTGATPVSVFAGSNTAPVNFGLLPGAGISGRVTDTNGTPLRDITISAYDENHNWLLETWTDDDGLYELRGLPAPGPFFIATDSANLNYIDLWFQDVPVIGTEIPPEAQPIYVPAGTILNNVNFTLQFGGGVTGSVMEVGGTPLPGWAVLVYTEDGTLVAATRTTAAGSYVIQGLPTRVFFLRTDSETQPYVDEWYDGVPALGAYIPETALPLTVHAGEMLGPIVFELALGGSITGCIVNTRGNGLPGVTVALYGSSANWLRSATTLSDGSYRISGLPTQYVYFVRTVAGDNYVDEWYHNVAAVGPTIPPGASSLGVATDAVTTANFVLATGGEIWGLVRDAAGSPLSGIAVVLYGTNGLFLTMTDTDPMGLFQIRKLPDQPYFLRTVAYPAAFQDEWYDNIPVSPRGIPPEAVRVTVRADDSVRADFTLGFFVVSCAPTPLGQFQLQWQTASGTTYIVESSDTLSAWTNAPEGTNAFEHSRQTAPGQGRLEYRDPQTNATKRFYRITIQP